jgi:signal transduction histidine kinase
MNDSNPALIGADSDVMSMVRQQARQSKQWFFGAVNIGLLLSELYSAEFPYPHLLSGVRELLPADCLTIIVKSSAEQAASKVEFWQWRESQPPTRQTCDIDIKAYTRLFSAPVCIEDITAQLSEMDRAWGQRFWSSSARSLISIPLLFAKQVIAIMQLSSDQQNFYGATQVSLLQMFGDGFAPLFAYYKLAESHRDLAHNHNELLKMQHETKSTLQTYIQKIEQMDNQYSSLYHKHQGLKQQISAKIQEHQDLKRVFRDYSAVQKKFSLFKDNYDDQVAKALDMGESIRQRAVELHRAASFLRENVVELQTQNKQMLREHAELVMDASSELIPQARSIYNHLQSLEDPSFGKLPPRQLRFVRNALRSGKYINRLLAELNDYSRCLTGQFQLAPDDLNISPILDETHGQFMPNIHAKQIKLEISAASKLPVIKADDYATRQLIYAMFEHIIDCTPTNGAINISLKPSGYFTGGLSVQITHDNEPMSEEDFQKLFTPFQRADFDPDDDIPPGLALAIAKQLTEIQKGRIIAQQLNNKLQFQIDLPANVSPDTFSLTGQFQIAISELPILQPLSDVCKQPFADMVSFPELPDVPLTSQDLNHSLSNESLEYLLGGEEKIPPPTSPPLSPFEPKPLPQAPLTPSPLQGSKPNLSQAPLTPSPLQGSKPNLSQAPRTPTPLPDSKPNLSQTPRTPSPLQGSRPNLSQIPLTPPPLQGSRPNLSQTPRTPSPLQGSRPNLSQIPLTPPPLPSISSSPFEPKASPPPLSSEKTGQKFPVSSDSDEQTGKSDSLELIDEDLLEIIFEGSEDDSSVKELMLDAVEMPPTLSRELVIEEMCKGSQDDQPRANEVSSYLPAKVEPPSLLCLSNAEDEPHEDFFGVLEDCSFQLALAPIDPNIFNDLNEEQRPTVLMLYSDIRNDSFDVLLQKMKKLGLMASIPVLTAKPVIAESKEFQLFWRDYRSLMLSESFWNKWLMRFQEHHQGKEYKILAFGFDGQPMDLYPLLRFCVGARCYLHTETNPTQAVQKLYQEPPQLLMLYIKESSAQWIPILQEIGRSARTREIAILIISHVPMNEQLEKALQPFDCLYLREMR